MEFIPFNIPYLTGKESLIIQDAIHNIGQTANARYTELCQQFIKHKYHFPEVLLTHSCTGALEMAALLSGVGPGDEVIVPSFGYVSTANAFALRGATIVPADSHAGHPNISATDIASLITPKTRVLVIIHYGGMACEMEEIMALVHAHKLLLVEDVAHGIGATHENRLLGSFGHLAAFSFHETKNIHAIRGGMLVVNDPSLTKRAEVIWEKGTDRRAFYRGETDRYSWVDLGSSFQMSELSAAFLWAQLQEVDDILQKRTQIWNRYYTSLGNKSSGNYWQIMENTPGHNAHIFYLLFETEDTRERARLSLLSRGVQALFHYSPIHQSQMLTTAKNCPNAEKMAATLLRLPVYPGLTPAQQEYISSCILETEFTIA